MKVQWAVQKLAADSYWIWGMKIPPSAAGMNNFIGPDGSEYGPGYTKRGVVDRLVELGITELSACAPVDQADERGITG